MGTRATATAVQLMRRCRELIYRVASAAERVVRLLLRLPVLPPLWLRRHSGPVRDYRSATDSMVLLLRRLDMLRGHPRILDLGCGCGSVAIALQGELDAKSSYLGIDVHGPSIAWCRRHLARDARFSFITADIRSPYSVREGRGGITGRSAAAEYSFPLPDASIDAVIAKSLFTHLLLDTTHRYLSEIGRCLTPSGLALASFFCFAGQPTPAFPHPGDPSAEVRWRLKSHPHAAVAYDRTKLERLVAEAGLEIVQFIPGFFPGRTTRPAGQDQLLLRRRREG